MANQFTGNDAKNASHAIHSQTVDGMSASPANSSTAPGQLEAPTPSNSSHPTQSAHDALEDKLREDERLARWRRE